MTMNLSAFGPPTMIRGMVALNQPGITGKVVTAVISASQATALNPGDFVKLDTSAQPAMPSVVAAAVGDTQFFGMIVWSTKKASFSAGDVVEIARPGTDVWLTAGATVAAGDQIEDTGSATVRTKASNALRGEAVDPGTNTQLIRCTLRNI